MFCLSSLAGPEKSGRPLTKRTATLMLNFEFEYIISLNFEFNQKKSQLFPGRRLSTNITSKWSPQARTTPPTKFPRVFLWSSEPERILLSTIKYGALISKGLRVRV